MTRIVRNRLFLALALGVAATAPRSLLLRSLPSRDVALGADAPFVDQRFSHALPRNRCNAPPALSSRLQETGVETRLGASLNAQTFDRFFLGDSTATFPPSFDDAFSPNCPNGACPLTPPTPPVATAPAGVLRSVVRVYNAYEETNSAADATLGPTRRRVVEKGSGAFVADSLGTRYVLTAAHIFRDGRGQITAQSLDGRIFAASLVLASEECDVALLRVDASRDVPALTISASWPRQGETVWRAGFGPNETLQELAGVVKGYVKTDRYATYETLKIDGPARQGDSGGPVYNASGEIVGVVWGTDGDDAYATYCGRVLKTLCDYSPTFAPDAIQADAEQAPPSLPSEAVPQKPEALNVGIPATCNNDKNDASTDDAPPSKFRDFWNAALAFTIVFAFGYCGFFATKTR
ncbi:MAG: trypsin-like peptidase domain-containing protein [Thermoguttaceae bacterium]|nr:trypsin-like peptidase domain-containing protein [Thermoguttaceae bacterium]